jgi:hypothetical protein
MDMFHRSKTIIGVEVEISGKPKAREAARLTILGVGSAG